MSVDVEPYAQIHNMHIYYENFKAQLLGQHGQLNHLFIQAYGQACRTMSE
jgi:hypothetical protein